MLRGAWRIFMQMRRMQRFMADPEGEMRRQAAKARAAAGGAAKPKPARRGKKIPRDVGEYVSYTEIEVTEEERRASSDRSQTSFKKEEQVTDIKWVDIE